jgi:aminotransferase
MLKTSRRSDNLQQSGIRSASVQCAAMKGINLGQGVCDMPVPDPIKKQAHWAIDTNKSLYSSSEGLSDLRIAIANKCSLYNGFSVDPSSEVVVTHGATGAFVCATMALFNSGDEVILFEPFYGYHKNILELYDITVKTIPIQLNDLSIDFDALKKIITPKTKGIVICTPNNPTGKVFTKAELLNIGALAEYYDLVIISDEIYEYITYPEHQHVSLASLAENYRARTITISGFSKTYNMTGWRLGYASGPTQLIQKIALIQDLLYICPVTPLQHALLAAFTLEPSYYREMNLHYLFKRDLVIQQLSQLGFKTIIPQGAYYILADFSELGFSDDEQAAHSILNRAKVATVPGRAFFIRPEQGKHLLRICYALHEDKIQLAMQALKNAFTKTL